MDKKVYTANPEQEGTTATTYLRNKTYNVIGLMSGTSMDGVDAALIRTDGAAFIERVGFVSINYEPEFKDKIRACLNLKHDPDGLIPDVARELTIRHAHAVEKLKSQNPEEEIELIGFHGQTILHEPELRNTVQIGDGDLLSEMTGIPVVYQFRLADVKSGGQGAPLIPVYHRALIDSADINLPAAIVNIGGVSNITWIGKDGTMVAFDTGPGNALIDDWMNNNSDQDFDDGGKIGLSGTIDENRVREWLQHPFFNTQPPKSLDRNAWDVSTESMSLADGAATLAAFTARTILQAASLCPEQPESWVITGGGRHNQAIMEGLRRGQNRPVLTT